MKEQDDILWTTDPDEIRRWVEKRCGAPALTVAEKTRIPMVDFSSGMPLEMHVTWDDWFRVFVEEHFAFICKEKRVDGTLSQFCQIIPQGYDVAATE